MASQLRRVMLGRDSSTGGAHIAPDPKLQPRSTWRTEPEGAGYLTVYPCGGVMPWASNLNFAVGQTISNHVTATIGANGKICVYASSTTNVVIDVEGTYSSA